MQGRPISKFIGSSLLRVWTVRVVLKERGYRSHIHRKAQANKPLSETAQDASRKRSKVRARVEHVFGAQQAMGGKLVRTIGLARARVKVGLTNIAYNAKRLVWLIENQAKMVA